MVDVDWYCGRPASRKYRLMVDLEKAALNGVSAADVSQTMQTGWTARPPACCMLPEAREDIPMRVQLEPRRPAPA